MVYIVSPYKILNNYKYWTCTAVRFPGRLIQGSVKCENWLTYRFKALACYFNHCDELICATTRIEQSFTVNLQRFPGLPITDQRILEPTKFRKFENNAETLMVKLQGARIRCNIFRAHRIFVVKYTERPRSSSKCAIAIFYVTNRRAVGRWDCDIAVAID